MKEDGEETITCQQMLEEAREVDRKYQELDRERLGRIWTPTEFLAACATDLPLVLPTGESWQKVL